MTCKAKAKDKAKDLSFEAKAKAKDLTFKAKAKDLSSKAKAKANDTKIVLKDSLRTRPRRRTNAAFHSSREVVFTRSRDHGNHEFTTCQWNAF